MKRGLLFLAIAVLAAGCGGDDVSTPSAAAAYQWRGPTVVPPVAKPDITLTDQDGKSWSLRANTHDRLALIYFGYTHCPDACPEAMATAALALRNLTPAQRDRIVLAFITTDPVRDTPARLKTWLARFDPAFVGLTGTSAQILKAQVDAHMPDVASLNTPGPDGTYGVDHDAFLLAFGLDDIGHLLYPGGVTAADETADFRELLEHGWHDPPPPVHRPGPTPT